MLAKALTMIAAEDDDGVVVELLVFQELNEAADLGVSKCDFAIIEMRRIFLIVRRWWTVGVMRIVKVHPDEKLFLVILAEPLERLVGNNVAGALHFVEI